MKKIWGLLVLLLTGCSTYTLIEPGRVAVNELYSVQPGMQWSQVKQGDVHLWTVDGAGLDSIRFISGIREGVPVMDITNQEQETKFRADMTETELVEAVVDAFSLAGAQQVRAKELQPAPFGTLDGFRFGVEFMDDVGLKKEGIVVGTVVQAQLYLIIYTGAKIHYFPKFQQEFETIIDSIEIHKTT